MRTDQLIAELAADRGPIPRPALQLALAMVGGALLALAGLTIAFGSPLEPVAERGLAASGLKLVYPLLIALFGVAAALAAGRPGDRPVRRLLPIAGAVLAIALIAAVEMSSASPADRADILFGSTMVRCVTAVALASIPVFAGLTWAFRLLAPERPALAGFLIGLSSGGAGAAGYALYCPETSHAFLLGAYTPAMVIPAAIGAITGDRLLRW
jgi:hypothetical protein